MRRVLFSIALASSFGLLVPMQVHAVKAESSSPTASALIAQDPNQDNLQMTCTGSLSASDIDYTVFFTREAGFSRIQFQRRSNGQQLAEAFLSYHKQNDKGQAVWRGAVNDAASVTLVHLASRPAQAGDQVSVKYDGRWGRGTCRR